MTNDNAPPEPIAEKVRVAMNEVIALGMEGGMHATDIIAELQKQIETLREDTARVDREGSHHPSGNNSIKSNT